MMDDRYLQQFSRHILLDQIGIEGQTKIAAAHVVVIGTGGLGCPAALYLAASGIGKLTLVDDDLVDLTNLQRQILHTTDTVGEPKVASGRTAVLRINPNCLVDTVQSRFLPENAANIVTSATVVLDCSDNFATRHTVNRACHQHKIPLISGAAVRFSGQLSVFTYEPNTPCYECLFPQAEDIEETRCALMGVFAPVTGIIGTLQAAEALKLIAGVGQTMQGKLMLYDGLAGTFRTIAFQHDPTCAICGHQASTCA